MKIRFYNKIGQHDSAGKLVYVIPRMATKVMKHPSNVILLFVYFLFFIFTPPFPVMNNKMVVPTLSALLQRVSLDFHAQRAVSIPGKIDVTYGRLQELINATASVLLSLHILHGDVVALSFSNTIEFVVLFLATLQIRATAAPLNPVYTSDEFEFYLSDSESKFVITPEEEHNSIKQAATKLGIRHITVRFCTTEGNIVFSGHTEELVGTSAVESVNDPSDVALFLHTSGTTSRPKGVPLTQMNLSSSVENIKAVYKLTESDSTVIVLPLFHVHGLLCGLLASLGSGGSVILPSSGRFSASTFWSDMRMNGATWYTAVPTIHQIMLERHLIKPEKEYPKLRFIRSCSASLAPSIMKRVEEAFGAPVVEAYAMTEATHLMTSNPLPEDGIRKPRSVGKAVGQEMCICDENGGMQEADTEGEVCVRGDNVTKGYRNNPQANKSAFHNHGWFRTGDLGFVDADGYLHLVGRIKELINRGGEKISPLEVDAILLSHPDIVQAVAFGVPDDKYGEEINCAVIVKEGAAIKETEVVEFCKKNLAFFKVPKKVFFTDSLPKTASGKIQRLSISQHFISKVSAVKV